MCTTQLSLRTALHTALSHSRTHTHTHIVLKPEQNIPELETAALPLIPWCSTATLC